MKIITIYNIIGYYSIIDKVKFWIFGSCSIIWSCGLIVIFLLCLYKCYGKRSELIELYSIILKMFTENNKNTDYSSLSYADSRPSVSYYMIHY